ncbi:hypothetical protein OKW50_000687 [Paraburkholderia youngii]|uniref:hypothetical protein n=1 Tax=Paraburkholderia youngii TaxID=2782701 RepID=UPI003D1A812C
MNDDLMRLAQWLREDWPVDHVERDRWADRVALRVDIDRDACRILPGVLGRTDLAADLRFELEMLYAALIGPRVQP